MSVIAIHKIPLLSAVPMRTSVFHRNWRVRFNFVNTYVHQLHTFSLKGRHFYGFVRFCIPEFLQEQITLRFCGSIDQANQAASETSHGQLKVVLPRERTVNVRHHIEWISRDYGQLKCYMVRSGVFNKLKQSSVVPSIERTSILVHVCVHCPILLAIYCDINSQRNSFVILKM